MKDMAQSQDKNWELTAYELQRKPQKISDDNTESAVTSKSLHKELMCPICLEILKNTMTTKECLHRFCANCIITALRNGNKECPTCRKKLVSKRSLRPDLSFDRLISQIYPNLDEYEAKHDENIAKLNTTYMQTFTKNIKSLEMNNEETSKHTDQSLENTNIDRRTRRKFFSISKNLSNLNQSTNSTSESNISTDDDYNSELTALEDIEIILKPYPSTELAKNNNDVRYIKTSAKATIIHLKKYLAMRSHSDDSPNLDVESKEWNLIDNIHIYILDSSDNLVLLNACDILQDLRDKFSKDDKPLDIFYSLAELKSGK